MTDPANLAVNAGSLVGILILIGFAAKQVIEWWRGSRKIESELRTATISDVREAHSLLKGMYSELKLQVADLESAVRDAKRREQETLAEHRAEISSLKRQYSEQLESMQQEVARLRRRLAEYEMDQ